MNLKPGSPGWKPPAGVEAEAAFLRGIRAWHAHPWQRDLADPPVIWTEGGARLLDYGGEGPVVLFVPSLVNGWSVLDLMEGHSMTRWLAEQGVHPMLLDWGPPEPAFTLTDYISGRLCRALRAAAMRADSGQAVLAGYCMGGTFAVAAAALCPDLISGLILLAAPWDFHAGPAEVLQNMATARALLPMLEPMLRPGTTVPVDWLQTLFALRDPEAVAEKFRRFARLDPDSDAARLFVAVEDWLNSGAALSATTALECLRDWYGGNLPMRGAWRIAGLPVDPAAIAAPAFVAVPKRDRIVPPGSAHALARLLPHATLWEPEAGHVGMTAGRRAPSLLWTPMRDWLRDTASNQSPRKGKPLGIPTGPSLGIPPARARCHLSVCAPQR